MEATASALQSITTMVLQFLESKSFFAAERALRAELTLLLESEATAPGRKITEQNLYTSELEKRLGQPIKLPGLGPAPSISDHTPTLPGDNVVPGSAAIQKQQQQEPPHDRVPLIDSASAASGDEGGSGSGVAGSGSMRQRLRMYSYHLYSTQKDENTLRKRFGQGSPQQRVLFHDPPSMPLPHATDLAYVSIPVVYNPRVNGLEDDSELLVEVRAQTTARASPLRLLSFGPPHAIPQCEPAVPCRRRPLPAAPGLLGARR